MARSELSVHVLGPLAVTGAGGARLDLGPAPASRVLDAVDPELERLGLVDLGRRSAARHDRLAP
jgi:hypothetical protein